MDREPEGGTVLLRKFKLELIRALCGDADFILQHCHSLCLLSQREYERVKATAVPSEQVRDILDCVMAKDDKQILSFLELLKKKEMQETFPQLNFLKDKTITTVRTAEEKSLKRRETLAEEVPRKQPRKSKSKTVTEKQLMLVARHIGSDWREVGRVALELTTIKLEQIEEENPRNHREQVFAMLRQWSMREREEATPARLHSLLTQEESLVDPERIDFLLDES